MSNPKAIAYDLGIALGSIGLWLVPVDAVRAIGYATSLVFSARGYCTGVTLLVKERKDDEVEAMEYDAGVDFHERLLESSLELKLQQLENRFTEFLIPLMAERTYLDKKLNQVLELHSEVSEPQRESQRESVATDVEEEVSGSSVTESDIRKEFPEHSDATNWKAILKALNGNATRSEIIKGVLNCREDVGNAYLELLKRKYL